MCNVFEIPNLVVQPMIEWWEPGGGVLASGNGITLMSSIYPVRTSDAGQYTCHATVVIESIGVNVEGQNSTTISVQSKWPKIIRFTCIHLFVPKQFSSQLWKYQQTTLEHISLEQALHSLVQ